MDSKQRCHESPPHTRQLTTAHPRASIATVLLLVAVITAIGNLPRDAASAVTSNADPLMAFQSRAFQEVSLAAHATGVPKGVSTSGTVRSSDGDIWFALARSNGIGSVYLLTNGVWKLQASFSLLGGVWSDLGAGGPNPHVGHSTLPGIAYPVFLFFSTGADSPRLIVVADWRGHWKPRPFIGATYGSVDTTTVLPSSDSVHGGLVESASNPCGCASPVVDTWYRYSAGHFRATAPPGVPLPCSASTFEAANGPGATFSAVACLDGWALVQGLASTGDAAVAIFNEQSHRWVEQGSINDGICTAEADVLVGIPTAILHSLARAIHLTLHPEPGACL
jgi:hypothetical protein